MATLLLSVGAAQAQTSPSLDAMLPRVLSQPTNYDASYAYIREAVAQRDYEAAIAALERLLYFNPDLTRAKYELGVAYFRMRSYDMAIRYFEETLASPGVEDDIRRRIEVMLPSARKEIEPSRFYGVLQLGMRYNSNVPGLPGYSLIRSYGRDVPNPGPYYGLPGASTMLLGDVLHVYDFQNQRSDQWETRVSGVGAAQFRFGGLSSMLVEATTGPRLAVAPDALPGVTFRPYAVVSYATLSLGRVGSTIGGGATLRAPITSDFYLEPGVDLRRANIAATNYLFDPASTINTGTLFTASLAGHWAAADWLGFDARAFYRRNSSYSPFFASNHVGFEVSAKYDFDPPWEQIPWKWSITPFLRYESVRFDAANPTIDPWIVRGDRQIRTGLQFDMPITAMLGVSALVQYGRDNSNLPNYRATSWSGLIGPTLRF